MSIIQHFEHIHNILNEAFKEHNNNVPINFHDLCLQCKDILEDNDLIGQNPGYYPEEFHSTFIQNETSFEDPHTDLQTHTLTYPLDVLENVHDIFSDAFGRYYAGLDINFQNACWICKTTLDQNPMDTSNPDPEMLSYYQELLDLEPLHPGQDDHIHDDFPDDNDFSQTK